MPSLYVHIPFCARKCLYCSFVVVISAEKHADNYVACLALESQHFRGTAIETIYIGGGTPSRLSEDQIGKLMKNIMEVFDCRHVSEITMETNPEDIDEGRLEAMRKAGVNRISLGVQTFDNGNLKYLGRHHDASCAVSAAQLISKFDFNSVNMDLMFGFEGQQTEDVRGDMNRMMEMGPDHISLYGLTIEANSRFFAQGKVTSSDQQAEMYLMILEAMKENRYLQYEVSNFSKPGHESVHNKNYWLGKEYIGLGVGAHSHQGGRRWWNIDRVHDYMERLGTGKSVEGGGERLNDTLRLKERLLFGLRMNEGADLGSLNVELKAFLDQEQLARINTYLSEGLLVMEGAKIKATDKGRLVLDEISSQLI